MTDEKVVAEFKQLDPDLPWTDQVPANLCGFNPAVWLTDAEKQSGTRSDLARARQRQRQVRAHWCHYAGVRPVIFERWLRFVTDQETL